jgi:hypothetical protein
MQLEIKAEGVDFVLSLRTWAPSVERQGAK